MGSSNPSKTDLILSAIASVPPTELFRVQEALAQYPELAEDSSALLDLAYEEFCQADQTERIVDRAAFAAQFPNIESSLLELLEVHSFILGNSKLAEEEPEIPWPGSGEEFLGFHLVKMIGEGAFARVFLAREIQLGHREVVVKISQRGETEAQKLGILKHPNIVPVYSVKTDEVVKLSALCMPYLGRTTAGDWINTRFQDVEIKGEPSKEHFQSVMTMGRGLCQGLQFAHEQHIFHCDVKPSNILITDEGNPVLLDFNLSIDREQEKHLVGGTLMYMAPEQLMRAAGNQETPIDARTDVFCLAASLYHMATGQPPFPQPRDPTLHLRHLIDSALENRRAFFERNHWLPTAFQEVLWKALAFDPDDRLSSAREFSEELARCLPNPAASRSRWLPIFASLGALGMAALVGYTLKKSADATPASVSPVFSQEGNPPETKPLPEKPPGTVEEFLRLAKKAEVEDRFDDAIAWNRKALEQLQNSPLMRWKVEHALAYCLLRNGQFEEARPLLSDLALNSSDPQILLNWAAVATRLCFQEGEQANRDLLNEAVIAVKKAYPQTKTSVEAVPVIAVLYAMLARQHEGEIRQSQLDRAINFSTQALEKKIDKAKILTVGIVLPELFQQEPFQSLQRNHPNLVPNRELSLPVVSPTTGESDQLKITLPAFP